MQYVYVVQGLGFGDDENVWELCSVHATQAAADAECKRIQASCELDESGVRVMEYVLQV